MGLIDLRARFEDFEGEFEINPEGCWARMTVEAASLCSGSERADHRLGEEDFLGGRGELGFHGGLLELGSDGTAWLSGELALGERQVAIDFSGNWEGPITDPWGKQRIGLSLIGRVNRFELGIEWNELTDSGVPRIGAECDIELELSAVRDAD
jgi:polyisoprenoid-binding protein YceI